MPASKKRLYRDPDFPKKRYVSVTTALGAEAKPALYRWNGKMAGKRALDHRDELAARLDPDSSGQFYQGKPPKPAPPYPEWVTGRDAEVAYDRTVAWLADAARDYTKARALRGTEVHQIAEDHIGGKPLPEDLTDEQQGMVNSVLRFLDDQRPEFLGTEVRVLNRDEGYAGTADGWVRLPAYPQELDMPVILDWKTGSGPWDEWGKQFAAYAHATHRLVSVDDSTDRAEPMDTTSHDLAVAVMITPETYRIVEFHNLGTRYAEFLAALRLYRAPKRAFTVIDPPAEQVRLAATVEDLYEIWARADYLGIWTPQLTELAATRKRELQNT